MTSEMEQPETLRSHDIEAPKTARVSRKQAWRVSVSLEFDLQPVLTWRGDVSASSPNGAANAAVKAARKEFAGKKPRTWAIVFEKS